MPELPSLLFSREVPDSETPACRLVTGSPGGQPRIGVVLKRTYVFRPGGGCEIAETGSQEEVLDDECVYEKLKPPKFSPVALDNDGFAFRAATDLVVQGHAYAYFSNTRASWVEARLGGFSRSIRICGERKVERGPDGNLRFTRPEPFEAIPVRYDRAYGGYDATALARHGLPPMLRDLIRSRPEYEAVAESPFHYPRNPTGRGYLMELDAESIARVEVPNLEFSFDPLTPERLAVGDPSSWIEGPLPACMDWQSATWFPRIGYLGLAPLPENFAGRVHEIERGWAAPDLLRTPSMLQAPASGVRPEFAQAASPGMSVADFPPGTVVELMNLHSEYPVCTLELPGHVPCVKLDLGAGSIIDLEPHLNAVVIRPDCEQVVMTWCAHAPRPPRLTESALDKLQFGVSWDSDPLRGLL